MKLPLLRTALLIAGSFLLALGGLAAPPVPQQAADEILVTRVPDVPSGAVWDITLPPGAEGTLTDQEWLVVDGQSVGYGGGFLPPDAADKPLKLYANANDEMDEMIKDTLKAQGFPVKQGVSVYHISLGLNVPVSISSSRTLRLRHSRSILMYTPIPAEKRYKVGDKIPLYDVAAIDASVSHSKIFDPKDPTFHTYARLPNDLAHRITIQIQFLPKPTR